MSAPESLPASGHGGHADPCLITLPTMHWQLAVLQHPPPGGHGVPHVPSAQQLDGAPPPLTRLPAAHPTTAALHLAHAKLPANGQNHELEWHEFAA